MNDAEDLIADTLVLWGENNPAIDAVVRWPDAPRWGIAFEDETMLSLEYSPERGTVTLTADIGRPPENDRLAVCEILLMYSSLHGMNSGTTMALSEPGGEFQQLCELPVHGTTTESLKQAIQDFADRAELWRGIVAKGPASEEFSFREFEMQAQSLRG